MEKIAFEGDRITRKSFKDYLESDYAIVLVASWGTEIDGAAVVELHGSAARLASLAVAPEYHRRGIGWVLLRSAEDAARARGCELMWLEVRDDNSPAIRLYAAAAYNRVGWRRNFYEDGATALVLTKLLVR